MMETQSVLFNRELINYYKSLAIFFIVYIFFAAVLLPFSDLALNVVFIAHFILISFLLAMCVFIFYEFIELRNEIDEGDDDSDVEIPLIEWEQNNNLRYRIVRMPGGEIMLGNGE